MHTINVSVVFATHSKQWCYEAVVNRGFSAQELISQSGFLDSIEDFVDVDLNSLEIGVYAQKVELDYLLQANDRLEIYRPLLADPKEVRRRLAKQGKTIGNKS